MIRATLLSIAFGLLLSPLWAQSSEVTAEILKFSLAQDEIDDEGRRGISMKLDLRIRPAFEAFDRRRFDLTWRLENEAGKTIYRSRDQADYLDQKESVMARKPWGKSTVRYMVKEGIEIPLPYALLPLPAGPQKLKIVFSLQNEYVKLKDFAARDLEFQQRVFVKHPLIQQLFKLEKLSFEYDVPGFGVKETGILVRFDLLPRYGQDESSDEGYTLYWLLRDTSGKVVFDSRKAESIHHREKHVYFKNLQDNRFRSVDLFMRYREIALSGPEKVFLVLIAEANEDERREIYAKPHRLDVPRKYRFAEQEFNLRNLRAQAISRAGAAGISINFTLTLSQYGPRLDPEIGDYVVYPVLRDISGNVLYAPPSFPTEQSGNGWETYATAAFTDQGPLNVQLFLPWYVLDLPPGKTQLQYSLFVTDRQKQFKFPELSKGGIAVTCPEIREYRVEVEEFRMKDGEYDTEVRPISSRLPDLQWTLRVGPRRRYTSPRRKNSLSAPKGFAFLKVARGDSIFLVLYDIDSGFFNQDDFLGSWNLPYLDGGAKFVIEERNQGNLSGLRVLMERRR
ncbi:MAG: hypothetical protein AAGN35_10835 [Bacteroidota bacterium]